MRTDSPPSRSTCRVDFKTTFRTEPKGRNQIDVVSLGDFKTCRKIEKEVALAHGLSTGNFSIVFQRQPNKRHSSGMKVGKMACLKKLMEK